MTATSVKKATAPKRTTFQLTPTADTDSYVYPIDNYESLAIKVTGITSDEIKAYTSLENGTPSRWKQLLDEFDVNPFTQDAECTLDPVNHAQLKIERVGSSDGNIIVDIGFTNK